ncbi:hypothetical protein BGW38_001764, partial [Lunasporangiospora selenospora]
MPSFESADIQVKDAIKSPSDAVNQVRPYISEEHFHLEQASIPGSYLGPLDASLPNADKIPLLFQPYTIKDLTMPNRIVVAPMCTYSSKGGFLNNFHLAHYTSYAMHGAGLITIEATGIMPNGRITPGCIGLWSDEHIHKLKEVVDTIHEYRSKVSIQLAHSGRKSSDKAYYSTHEESEHWRDNVVGPSGGADLRWDETLNVPRELSIEEIQEVVKAWGQATARAVKAGVDAVEIHGAHGYLIHSFLSPISNKRTDRYGGSLENRARLLLEVIREVRANLPEDKPLFLRVSASDMVETVVDEPSWDIDQTVQVAKWAKEAGLDVLHVSSGGNSSKQKIVPVHGYQVPFAEKVKKEVPGLQVIAVGIITTGKQAEEILEKEKADLIAIGRAYLQRPTFAIEAARDLNVKAAVAMQYTYGRY